MRQYFFWALLVLFLPYIIKNPFLGVALYTAFNIIRPETLFWGGSQAATVFIILISVTALATFLKQYKSIHKPSLFTIMILPVDFLRLMIKEILSQSQLRLILWVYFGLVVSIELSSYNIPRVYTYYYANEILKLVILCTLIVINVKSSNEVKMYENIMLIAIVLLGVWGIDQHFRGNARLEGLGGKAFPDSNGIAAIFVLFLPLAFNKVINPVKKKDLYVGFVSTGIIISLVMFTQSRGGFLGLIVSAFIITLLSRHRVKIFMIMLVFYIAVSPFFTGDYLNRIETLRSQDTMDYSGRSRLILWQAGLKIFRDNPMFGTGFLSFPTAKMQYKDEFGYLDKEFHDYVFQTKGSRVTHNTYIQLLSDGGLFLGLPFFGLIIGTVWSNWRIRRMKFNITDNNDEMINLLSAIEAGIIAHCVCIMFIDALTGVFLYIQITVSAIIRNIINNKRATSSPMTSTDNS